MTMNCKTNTNLIYVDIESDIKSVDGSYVEVFTPLNIYTELPLGQIYSSSKVLVDFVPTDQEYYWYVGVTYSSSDGLGNNTVQHRPIAAVKSHSVAIGLKNSIIESASNHHNKYVLSYEGCDYNVGDMYGGYNRIVSIIIKKLKCHIGPPISQVYNMPFY